MVNAKLSRETFLGCRLSLDFDSQTVWTRGLDFDSTQFGLLITAALTLTLRRFISHEESFVFNHRRRWTEMCTISCRLILQVHASAVSE